MSDSLDFPWETRRVMGEALDLEVYRELPDWAKQIYKWATETASDDATVGREDQEFLKDKLVLIDKDEVVREAEEIIASAKNRGGSS